MVSYRLIHSFIRSILIGITFIYLLITITITTTMRVCDTIIYNINNCCSAHSRINFERSIRFDSIWYDSIRFDPSPRFTTYSIPLLNFLVSFVRSPFVARFLLPTFQYSMPPFSLSSSSHFLMRFRSAVLYCMHIHSYSPVFIIISFQ